MIDIVVQCPGKESVTVQKPDTGATFTVFRRILYNAYKRNLSRGFKLYHKDALLTYETFNQLKDNDVLTIKEEEGSGDKETYTQA